MENLINRIKRHESWRAKPYPDPIHGWAVPTFGYGFTYLTPEEGDIILKNRILMIQSVLQQKIGFFHRLPPEVKDVLVEMAYQLGVPGLLQFKKTLRYLAAGKYRAAAAEMLDSKWHKQTPKRAEELANIVRKYENTARKHLEFKS